MQLRVNPEMEIAGDNGARITTKKDSAFPLLNYNPYPLEGLLDHPSTQAEMFRRMCPQKGCEFSNKFVIIISLKPGSNYIGNALSNYPIMFEWCCINTKISKL